MGSYSDPRYYGSPCFCSSCVRDRKMQPYLNSIREYEEWLVKWSEKMKELEEREVVGVTSGGKSYQIPLPLPGVMDAGGFAFTKEAVEKMAKELHGKDVRIDRTFLNGPRYFSVGTSTKKAE